MLNLTPITVVKLIATTAVGAGTTRIVGGIISNNTNPEKVHDKIAVASASFVIGSMAADATKKYTDAKIDEVAAWLENFKNRNKTEQSED